MESFRGVKELFNAVVEAEERHKGIQNLIAKGVGLPMVENYHKKLSSACRVPKNKRRNVNSISSDMKIKLKDAKDHLKKLNRSKSKIVKKIKDKFGTEKGKEVIKDLVTESEKKRSSIQKKNAEKTKHLSEKFQPNNQTLPDLLSRFETASIFTDAEIENLPHNSEPLIYGDLSLDEDERQAMMIDPKFAVFDALDEEDFETEVEMCCAKMRWNNFDEEEDPDLDEKVEISEEEQERLDTIEAKQRQVYDSDAKLFDMRNLKATDVKQNTFVYLPENQGVKYEAQLEVRRNEYLKIFRQYVKENCNEHKQQKSNLTESERKGVKKLKKRISDGEIMICSTDKSGRLAVMPMEMYHQAAQVHIDKDKEVTFEEAKAVQKVLNGHVSMWLKITGMGERWDHEARQRETHIEHSTSIGPLYLLVKDHKSYSGAGPPPTRPVCGAVAGMNVHLSNIISPFLDTIADEMEDTVEIISTEDALSRIDAVNKSLEDGGEVSEQDNKEEYETDEDEFLTEEEKTPPNKQNDKLVLIGADVVQLFPSLEANHSSKLVNKSLLETKVQFDGINYVEVATYLAMELTEWQARSSKIHHLLPKRRFKKGQKPKITGINAMAAEPKNTDYWIYPKRQFTPEEESLLLGKALEVAVKTLFTTHLYQFGGRIYHQVSGSPIGTRFSMSTSRVVMGMWDIELSNTMKKEDLNAMTAFRFVDDWRQLMRGINLGWRWHEKKLMFRHEWEKEDIEAGLTTQEVTTREMMKMMNSIYSNLNFEMETEDMFENNRLPTLDFACWVDNNKIYYSFFQKPMARKTVINKKSALSERTKVSSLSQELIRRMKNTSEDVPMKERIDIIDEYAKQLVTSGYSPNQARDIIQAGLVGYETLVEKVEKKEAVLHRSASEGAGERKRKKLLGKGNWFVQKKGRKTVVKQGKQNLKKRSKEQEKEKDFTTVLFVKQTPNGVLAKRLQKVENDISKLTGDRVKIVERGGTSVKKMLIKSNPWAGSLCGRENCLPCMFGDGQQDCFSKGVVYDLTCTTCDDEAKEINDINAPIYRYTGTTARSLHERGAEHFKSFMDKDQEKSVMFKHSLDKHGGNFVEFNMKIVKKHYSAFSRLVHEAVRIDRNSRDANIMSLNSKSEYGRGHLPRLTIEDSENTKIGIKGCVTESSLDVQESKNVMKMKDRIDEPVKADCSKDGSGKNNFNLNHDSLNNFDALRTAAPETKPNNGGKYSFKYRQKIDETKHTNLVKVRKRRRPS